MEKPTRCAIYVRISRDDAPDSDAVAKQLEDGVTRQIEDCRTFIAQHAGWVEVGLYVDNDISAHSGKKRPDYDRLMTDVDARQLDVVVVNKTSRLSRNRTQAMSNIERFAKAKVDVYPVKAQPLILNNAAGQMMAAIFAIVDAWYADEMGESRARAILQQAQRGQFHGPTPFGYRKIYTQDRDGAHRRYTGRLEQIPEQAELIRDAARRVLNAATVPAGASDDNSLRGILRDWRDRGFDKAPVEIKRILLNPLYIGKKVYNGKAGPAEVFDTDCWDPILDADDQAMLRVVLTNPSRRISPGATPRHLLTGIAECSECGAATHVKNIRNKHDRTHDKPVRRMYSCIGTLTAAASHVGCPAGAAEERVRTSVFYWLDNGAFDGFQRAERDTAVDARPLLKAQADDQDRLNNLVDLVTEGIITPGEAKRKRAEFDARIAARQAQIDNQGRMRLMNKDVPAERGAELAAAWERWGLDERRRLVAALVDKVIIHPTRKGGWQFDPSRVEVVAGQWWAEGLAPETLVVPTTQPDMYYRSPARDAVTIWLEEHPDCDISGDDMEELGLVPYRRSHFKGTGKGGAASTNALILRSMYRAGLLEVSKPGKGGRGGWKVRYRLANAKPAAVAA